MNPIHQKNLLTRCFERMYTRNGQMKFRLSFSGDKNVNSGQEEKGY